ncbi:MAG: hypothetical protein D6704_04005 [Nitrospirae bacterium]|nr:MAG: hypothetical protein D6704_04005 [Nitrospirota bacterium]
MIVLAAMSFTSCLGTPQVETELYRDSQVRLVLSTAGDEGYRADHPVTFDPTLVEQILRGIQWEEPVGPLQTLVTGEATPKRLFADEHVTRLAPQLVQAFAHATPEEYIVVELHSGAQAKARGLRCLFFHHDHAVHVIVVDTTTTLYRAPKPTQPASSFVLSHLHAPQILFFPEEVVHYASPGGLRGARKTHLVIDYDRLTHLSLSPADNHPLIPDSRPHPRATNATTHESPMLEPASMAASHARQDSDHRSHSGEMQKLLKEVQRLRQELNQQQAELERLKKGLSQDVTGPQ